MFVNLLNGTGAKLSRVGRKSARSRKRIRESMASHQIEEVVEVKCPSDFRLRDYVLGQDLFMLRGFDDYMLQGNW